MITIELLYVRIHSKKWRDQALLVVNNSLNSGRYGTSAGSTTIPMWQQFILFDSSLKCKAQQIWHLSISPAKKASNCFGNWWPLNCTCQGLWWCGCCRASCCEQHYLGDHNEDLIPVEIKGGHCGEHHPLVHWTTAVVVWNGRTGQVFQLPGQLLPRQGLLAARGDVKHCGGHLVAPGQVAYLAHLGKHAVDVLPDNV